MDRSLLSLDGLFIRSSEKALLFFDDNSGQEVWIPFSVISDWWFTGDGTKRHLEMRDLELNDLVTLVVKTWFARKEGIEP